MNDYILISPIKNEEKFFPILAHYIINQTKIPKVWVIVDGNSTDNTIKIVENLILKYNWIYLKKQEKITYQKNHMSFAYAVYEGYEYAKSICQKYDISYDYVGKIDADVIITNNFFEKLILKFENDPLLGVASGSSYTLINPINNCFDIRRENCVKNKYLIDELPDKRLYRKTYLEDVGGFPLSKYSPDTVLLAKFRLNNFEIKSFGDVSSYNLRDDTGTERNLWKSFNSYGASRYYLDYHPFLVILNAVKLTFRKPYYSGIAYLTGYLSGYTKNDGKIEDTKVRTYFRKQRFMEIITMFIRK